MVAEDLEEEGLEAEALDDLLDQVPLDPVVIADLLGELEQGGRMFPVQDPIIIHDIDLTTIIIIVGIFSIGHIIIIVGGIAHIFGDIIIDHGIIHQFMLGAE